MAISAGVTAPISRPTGACTRSRHSGGMPSARSAVVDARDLRAAADQAEILEIARRQRAHRFEIVLMAAREDDDVRGRRQVGAVQPLRDGLDDDLGARKAIGVGELVAIVDDVDVEAGVGRDFGQVPADMPGPDDVQPRRGRKGIDVHVHTPAADQAVLLGEVIVELVVDERGLSGRDRLARFPEGVVLVAAAADGPDRPPVGPDEHLGARALGRRALRAHDRDERDALAAPQRLGRRRQHFLRSDEHLDLGFLLQRVDEGLRALTLLLLASGTP